MSKIKNSDEREMRPVTVTKRRGGSRNDHLDYLDDYEFESGLRKQLRDEARMDDNDSSDASGRL